MAKYNIQNKEFELKPITLGQIKKLAGLLKDVEIGEETSPMQIVEQVAGSDSNAFFDTIFGETGVKWDDVPYDTIEEIMLDFLSVNPRLKNRLTGLLGSLGLTQAESQTHL